MKYKGSYFTYLLMNTFYFLSLALFSAIISVYLMDLGFNARKISIVIVAQYLFFMMTQPFIGKLCDAYDKDHRYYFSMRIGSFRDCLYVYASFMVLA